MKVLSGLATSGGGMYGCEKLKGVEFRLVGMVDMPLQIVSMAPGPYIDAGPKGSVASSLR